MAKAINQDDIARQLGLSKTIVSYVLSGQARRRRVAIQTEQRVLALARAAGYVPNAIARSLRTRRTGTIGIVVTGFEQDHTHRLNLGFERVFDPLGYTPFFSVRGWDAAKERREMTFLLERQVDGIIVVVPLPENETFYRDLGERVPILFCADTLEGAPWANHVIWDSGPAARVAVRHLVETGRRRIGFIRTEHRTQMTQARHQAWAAALAETGLPVREEWVFREPLRPELGRPAVEEWIRQLYTAGRDLGDSDKPDAFFLLNDGLARQTIMGLRATGRRVPRDVALVGMGHLPLVLPGRLGLTSMASPLERLGEHAAEVILRLIGAPDRNTAPAAGPVREAIEHNELVRGETT